MPSRPCRKAKVVAGQPPLFWPIPCPIALRMVAGGIDWDYSGNVDDASGHDRWMVSGDLVPPFRGYPSSDGAALVYWEGAAAVSAARGVPQTTFVVPQGVIGLLAPLQLTLSETWDFKYSDTESRWFSEGWGNANFNMPGLVVTTPSAWVANTISDDQWANTVRGGTYSAHGIARYTGISPASRNPGRLGATTADDETIAWDLGPEKSRTFNLTANWQTVARLINGTWTYPPDGCMFLDPGSYMIVAHIKRVGQEFVAGNPPREHPKFNVSIAGGAKSVSLEELGGRASTAIAACRGL